MDTVVYLRKKGTDQYFHATPELVKDREKYVVVTDYDEIRASVAAQKAKAEAVAAGTPVPSVPSVPAVSSVVPDAADRGAASFDLPSLAAPQPTKRRGRPKKASAPVSVPSDAEMDLDIFPDD